MADGSEHIEAVVKAILDGKSDETIVKWLKGKRVHDVMARDLVRRARRTVAWETRKGGFWKMLGSGVVLVIFVAIFLTTGILFWYIIPFAALGFLWGMIQTIFGVREAGPE